MKFTSITFGFFFLLVYFLYWQLKGKSKLVFIFLASLLFYAAWSPSFAIHFLAIAIFNYIAVVKLFDSRSKLLLSLILFVDLSNLFLFKYFYLLLDFFYKITNIEIFRSQIFNSWLEQNTGSSSIFLPLAISFYSFVFIAYAVDVYKGKIEEKEGFLEYFTFIFYFPHLVAGPIIRHSDFFYQIKNPIIPDPIKITNGLYLILQGMLKKLIIADNIAPIIQPIFADPNSFNSSSAWIATIGYSVRVYCDFSGYTDIARGLSKLLGLELPENFLAPYLTTNVRDLWKKWHYTLSTWIRDYIYFPLGGSKSSELRNIFNLTLAFTIGGLWHGANYTFLVWGAWNGFVIAIERRLCLVLPFLNSSLEKGINWKENIRYFAYLLLGFIFTQWVWLIGTCFFNSENIEISFQMILSMHSFQSGKMATGSEPVGYAFVMTLFFNFLQKKNWEGFGSSKLGILSLFIFSIFSLLILGLFTPEGAEFIYFQF
jgi:alginate O-acetyltransferase complex protein AlgI